MNPEVKKFHLVWNGEISMNSSFGIAACEQITAFEKLGYRVYLLASSLKVKAEPIPDNIMNAIKLTQQMGNEIWRGNSVFIHQGFPHYFHNCNVPAKIKTGLGVNDSDEVMGADVINKTCTMVWAGSNWTRDAYKKAGVTVPAYTMAYGINPDNWNFITRKDKPIYTFLSVGDYTGRKRIDEMLEAFMTEFGDDEPVKMIYKAWGSPVGDVEKKYSHRKNIKIYWSESTIADLKQFYQEADCFVLPTSGDSIGMPYLEALATGMPCITTSKGGQTQWCTKDNSWLLDCVEYKSPYLAGNQYMPDFQQLRKLMRHASQNVLETRNKGRLGSTMMLYAYKWIDGVKYAAEKIEEYIDENCLY